MTAAEQLAHYFDRNGVLRAPNPDRRKQDGASYHQGYEIRLVAFNEVEAAQILRSLKVLRIKAGRPFAKVHRTMIPIYGREQVLEFLAKTKVSVPDLPAALRP